MRTFVLVSVSLALFGCDLLKRKKDDTSATTVTSASAATTAAAPVKLPCTLGDVSTIDKGVRADSGLTLVVLDDGRISIGYATGAGDPKVAVIDKAGKSSSAEIDTEYLKTKEKKDPKTTRTLLRVTPLGFDGMKMEVGIDFIDALPDKSKYLRCGPANGPGFLFEGGPNDTSTGDEGSVIDCRTFSDDEKTWVLASIVAVASAMEGKLPMRWVVDAQGGRQSDIDNTVLDEKTYDAKALNDHEANYAYQVPVGLGVPGVGFVFAARQEGALVLARRTASLDKAGEPVRYALGGSITMPALAGVKHQAAVFVGLAGKTDLLGSTFAIESKPNKPEKIALEDPSPPTDGDRNSITAAFTPTKGDIFVAFADGKTGAKQARMTVLGADLKSKVAVFDVTPKGSNVSELRVASMADDKAFVTWLQDGEIKSSIVSCSY